MAELDELIAEICGVGKWKTDLLRLADVQRALACSKSHLLRLAEARRPYPNRHFPDRSAVPSVAAGGRGAAHQGA